MMSRGETAAAELGRSIEAFLTGLVPRGECAKVATARTQKENPRPFDPEVILRSILDAGVPLSLALAATQDTVAVLERDFGLKDRDRVLSSTAISRAMLSVLYRLDADHSQRWALNARRLYASDGPIQVLMQDGSIQDLHSQVIDRMALEVSSEVLCADAGSAVEPELRFVRDDIWDLTRHFPCEMISEATLRSLIRDLWLYPDDRALGPGPAPSDEIRSQIRKVRGELELVLRELESRHPSDVQAHLLPTLLNDIVTLVANKFSLPCGRPAEGLALPSLFVSRLRCCLGDTPHDLRLVPTDHPLRTEFPAAMERAGTTVRELISTTESLLQLLRGRLRSSIAQGPVAVKLKFVVDTLCQAVQEDSIGPLLDALAAANTDADIAKVLNEVVVQLFTAPEFRLVARDENRFLIEVLRGSGVMTHLGGRLVVALNPSRQPCQFVDVAAATVPFMVDGKQERTLLTLVLAPGGFTVQAQNLAQGAKQEGITVLLWDEAVLRNLQRSASGIVEFLTMHAANSTTVIAQATTRRGVQLDIDGLPLFAGAELRRAQSLCNAGDVNDAINKGERVLERYLFQYLVFWLKFGYGHDWLSMPKQWRAAATINTWSFGTKVDYLRSAEIRALISTAARELGFPANERHECLSELELLLLEQIRQLRNVFGAHTGHKGLRRGETEWALQTIAKVLRDVTGPDRYPQVILLTEVDPEGPEGPEGRGVNERGEQVVVDSLEGLLSMRLPTRLFAVPASITTRQETVRIAPRWYCFHGELCYGHNGHRKKRDGEQGVHEIPIRLTAGGMIHCEQCNHIFSPSDHLAYILRLANVGL